MKKDIRSQKPPTSQKSKMKAKLDAARNAIPKAEVPIKNLPADIKATIKAVSGRKKRFHGAKFPHEWVSGSISNGCGQRFGYITSEYVRRASRLDLNPTNINLLNQLGQVMGDPTRPPGGDSNIPSGYTYFGQFVDHDITLDVTSSIEISTDADTIPNMRTPALDLDNLYGRGPALDPFLYNIPQDSTAVKFILGNNNTNFGAGGPSTNGGGSGGMSVKDQFDLPRMAPTQTAVIGDPRNDENLIVSQFHMAMLMAHNETIDLVTSAGFTGDVFTEARTIMTHHFQWSVVHDFLVRICGSAAVTNALGSVAVSIDSPFRMPVEFSVAAYRFGHSLIRNQYWLSHAQTNASLADVFNFVRVPNLPVLSNWVVDFNAFFETGVNVPIFNHAMKIDSFLAGGLSQIPGGAGIMGILAARNLRRGLAFGLPSGQATAAAFGLQSMTQAELTQGLPQAEIDVLTAENGLLLNKTPLWYYILREAAVQENGDRLGALGARIVAETFITMLKRDSSSFLNKSSGFTPFLPSRLAGKFTVADLIAFSKVNLP